MFASTLNRQTDPTVHVCGLDLGQSQDFTALIALARQPIAGARPGVYRYTARGIKRWPLGTLYPSIVSDVAGIVAMPPLAGCVLAVDKTGVGAAVVDMFTAAKPKADIRPVLITAGHNTTREGRGWHVPKKELVGTLLALIQSRRLDLPDNLPEVETLRKELLSFRARITAAKNETFEADWRERAHDDLILALAIATFVGEQLPSPTPGCIDLRPIGTSWLR